MPRFSCLLLLVCVAAVANSEAQQQSATPIEFLQRQDVSRELNLSTQQLELANRLQPICDAQCQAELMQLFFDAGTDVQTQFLSLSPEQQQATVGPLESNLLEQIESEILADNVLSELQAIRFQQLRTQFRGLASLLDQRVGNLMDIDQGQFDQLSEIQETGEELIAACQANPSLTSDQQQAQIQVINNVLIDQSINILNDAQIGIFIDLSGSTFNFFDGQPPTDGDQAPEGPSTGPGDQGPSQGSGARPQQVDPLSTPPTTASSPTTRTNTNQNNRRNRPVPQRNSNGSSTRNIGLVSPAGNSNTNSQNQGSQRR